MPSPLPIMMKIAIALVQCQSRVASAWRLMKPLGEEVSVILVVSP